MYASLTSVRGAGPEVNTTARMAAESMLTWLREFEGYRGLLILGDPETGKARIVSFWDSLEALERSDKSRREVRESLVAVAGAELESVVPYELFLGKDFPAGGADPASEHVTPAVARFTMFEGAPESIEEGLRTFREDLVDWFRDATGFRGWTCRRDARSASPSGPPRRPWTTSWRAGRVSGTRSPPASTPTSRPSSATRS